MKLFTLLLGAFLAAALLAGCTHAPTEYSPKNATEKAVLAYTKSKIANLVVVNIEAPKPPPAAIAAMVAAAGAAHANPDVQYKVTLSDPKDDTLHTAWMVHVDSNTSQPIDKPDAPKPGPLVKIDQNAK